MQRSSTLIQQLQERWTTLLNRLQNDPRVARLMMTRMGQYISNHPSFSLALLLFGGMAALPVGIFLTFALATFVVSAAGFVFFEAFLLVVGGLILLSVLIGVALFALLLSVFANALLVSFPINLKNCYPHWAKNGINHSAQEETETSASKEQ